MKSSSPPSGSLWDVLPHARGGKLMWWLKLLVAAGCLGVMGRLLFTHPVPLAQLWQHPGWLLAALLLRPLFTLVLSVRTFTLARVLAPDLARNSVIRATFIGQMANLVLPGGAGGDLVRGTMLGRDSREPWPRIVTLLVADRLLGTLSLLLFVGILSVPLLRHLLSPAELSLGGLLGGGLLALAWLGITLARPWLSQSGLWQNTISATARIPRGQWLRAGALALLGHALLILSFSLLFSALDVGVSWADRAGIVALSLFLSSLPLTLGGHGIREGTLVLLLAAPVAWTDWPPFTPMQTALSLAAAAWVIHVAANFAGGMVALALPGQRPAPPAP